MNRIRIFLNNLMGRIRYLFARWRRKVLDTCTLSAGHWRWAALGILLLILLVLAGALVDFIGVMSPLVYLGMVAMTLGIPLLIGLGIRLGLGILGAIPPRYGWIFFGAAFFVFFFFGFPDKAMILIIMFLLLSGAFIGGGLYNLTGDRWNSLRKVNRILTVIFLVLGTGLLGFGIWFTAYPGRAPEEISAAAMETETLPEMLAADDPSLPGPFRIDSLCYGWGKDRRRPEFGEETDIVTPTMDGSSFLNGWDKLAGKLRTFYWKVGPDSLPLNGRVWYPEGAGPFPLVLMVHGNHLDRDFSDPGYAYLGRHFASHGIIAVSVDENFLNGAWSDFDHPLDTENDCRGWLLLKHLEEWDRWSRTDSSRFFRKVDMERVVLIGHSRGGEAVSIAACFNRLPYYPDNAAERFEFGFGIRGVAAIAPVDGQYSPAGIPTPVRDVNYFTIHGSMDGDMRSFHGIRQMRRIRFTDTAYHFVSGLYVHGANHGQFNRSWGKFDMGYPTRLFINRRAIIPAGEQEQVALVYLTAFIKETVAPGSGYRELFRDYRTGRDWLPELVLLNQFHESATTVVCGFEEDIDLVTGSYGVDSVAADRLALWKESRIRMKWGDQYDNGVYLGWNNEHEEDTLPGEYRIHLSGSLPDTLSGCRYLTFLAADAQTEPGDRMGVQRDTAAMDEGSFDGEPVDGEPVDGESVDRDSVVEAAVGEDSAEEEAGDEDTGDEDTGDEDTGEPLPVDFEIRLTDADGRLYRMRLGDHMKLQPPIKPTVYKSKLFWEDPDSEVILQYVRIPLEAFRFASQANGQSVNEELSNPEEPGISGAGTGPTGAGAIRTITFVFDGEGKGSVVLDQIGFSR